VFENKPPWQRRPSSKTMVHIRNIMALYICVTLFAGASLAAATKDIVKTHQEHQPSLAAGFMAHSQDNSKVNISKIEPKLDPVSDKKFFKKDYPDDLRPGATHKFSFPFPSVQDSEDYDKDFVKDENSDGGEWKAQMEYDQLRSKLMKEKNDLKKLTGKQKEDLDALKKAIDEEHGAEDKLKSAEGKAKSSTDKVNQAQDDLDKTSADIPKYTNGVDQAVANLKECEEELERARARLKALTEERDAALKRRNDADSVRKESEKSEQTAQQASDVSKKKAEAAGTEYDSAKKDLAKYQDEITSMERQMKQAEMKLRKFRKESVDQDGGVYRVPEQGTGARSAESTGLWARSGAGARSIPVLMMLMSVMLCCLA